MILIQHPTILTELAAERTPPPSFERGLNRPGAAAEASRFGKPLPRRRLALAVVLGASMHLHAPAWSQAVAAKRILYVTRLNLPAEADTRQKDIHQKGLASDQDVRRHLEARGFQVTLADQAAPPDKARGFDLVIISSVVRSLDMAETAYKDLPVPLMTWENDLFDSLRLTGRRKGIDYGEVEKEHYIRVVNAPHPLAAGLPPGKTYIYTRDLPVGWGTPARSAIVIATLSGDPDKAVVFGYEKGATMDHDLNAPARRVAFFLDNTTFGHLSPHGLRLFDASVDWALTSPAKTSPSALDR